MYIPKYIQDFIAMNEKLQKEFMKLSPSHKREYVSWIESAKKKDTQQRRMKKMQEMILNKEN